MTTTAPAAFARTRNGTGPGLLLAHGAGGGIEANYGPIMAGLSALHSVVGIDYPGAGATPRSSDPLDLDELADQLVAAADAEGLETFAVSGYSLGGPVAIRLATRHPERVNALVLSAAFGYADTRTVLGASIWQHLFETGPDSALAQYLNLMTMSEQAVNALTPAQIHATAEYLAAALPSGTSDHLDLVQKIDVRPDLAKIEVPTLVVVTTGDPLISPGLQRELAATIPGAEIAELASGHLPFIENPHEWLNLISGFLAPLTARP